MQIYQCPNCGRTYTEFQNVHYCGTCNYKLVNKEDIKSIKHPEISKREYKIVGQISDPTKPSPKCPTCQSTNIRKIGAVESGASIFAFGLFSKKINKTFKCNNCSYTW